MDEKVIAYKLFNSCVIKSRYRDIWSAFDILYFLRAPYKKGKWYGKKEFWGFKSLAHAKRSLAKHNLPHYKPFVICAIELSGISEGYNSFVMHGTHMKILYEVYTQDVRRNE
jgi:hypothetical protein